MIWKNKVIFKVHIFWEGHKIFQNLPLTFDHSTYSQKLGEDFAKVCGLLRIYELYYCNWSAFLRNRRYYTVLVIFASIGKSLYLCLLTLHAHNLEYSSSAIDFSWVKLTLKTAFSISPHSLFTETLPYHFMFQLGAKESTKQLSIR